MAGKKVSAPKLTKQASVAEVLFKDFENLPGEIRFYLTRYSGSTEELGNVASGINTVLGEISGSASGDELRRAATLVRSHALHAHRALLDLQSFAGSLDGLAWAVEAKRRAETYFER